MQAVLPNNEDIIQYEDILKVQPNNNARLNNTAFAILFPDDETRQCNGKLLKISAGVAVLALLVPHDRLREYIEKYTRFAAVIVAIVRIVAAVVICLIVRRS